MKKAVSKVCLLPLGNVFVVILKKEIYLSIYL